MSYLALSVDEIALLRFTCDLFFVEESPLAYIDRAARDSRAAEQDPDFERLYRGLVERNIVDPAGFRITDFALNRLAPVTECDGRIVHVRQDRSGDLTQSDFYLLDEIAVPFERQGDQHLLGKDMDPDEFMNFLGRRMEARRTPGDGLIDLQLSPVAFTALGALSRAVMGGHELHFSNDEVATAVDGEPLQSLTKPERSTLRFARTVPSPDPRAALDELALAEVVELHPGGRGVSLQTHFVDFVRGLDAACHETFVRYDFSDENWATREATFVPIEGSLFVIRPTGVGIEIRELDADGLRDILIDVLGPLVPPEEAGPPRSLLRELLLAHEDDEQADPTQVMR